MSFIHRLIQSTRVGSRFYKRSSLNFDNLSRNRLNCSVHRLLISVFDKAVEEILPALGPVWFIFQDHRQNKDTVIRVILIYTDISKRYVKRFCVESVDRLSIVANVIFSKKTILIHTRELFALIFDPKCKISFDFSRLRRIQ